MANPHRLSQLLVALAHPGMIAEITDAMRLLDYVDSGDAYLTVFYRVHGGESGVTASLSFEPPSGLFAGRQFVGTGATSADALRNLITVCRAPGAPLSSNG